MSAERRAPSVRPRGLGVAAAAQLDADIRASADGRGAARPAERSWRGTRKTAAWAPEPALPRAAEAGCGGAWEGERSPANDSCATAAAAAAAAGPPAHSAKRTPSVVCPPYLPTARAGQGHTTAALDTPLLKLAVRRYSCQNS
ncbi:uncharacterized protein LOC126252499 [Schistocerca nitens]|uniref:uncharacterized protein LOC126252499 n=1 Tax=Schistocerca nitens TaxID=7011 RepID=UPI00211800FF|nr:uncharacterized protein LOC126252499 [Schistocerca nitens]